jgi:hypothetical protein
MLWSLEMGKFAEFWENYVSEYGKYGAGKG